MQRPGFIEHSSQYQRPGFIEHGSLIQRPGFIGELTTEEQTELRKQKEDLSSKSNKLGQQIYEICVKKGGTSAHLYPIWNCYGPGAAVNGPPVTIYGVDGKAPAPPQEVLQLISEYDKIVSDIDQVNKKLFKDTDGKPCQKVTMCDQNCEGVSSGVQSGVYKNGICVPGLSLILEAYKKQILEAAVIKNKKSKLGISLVILLCVIAGLVLTKRLY